MSKHKPTKLSAIGKTVHILKLNSKFSQEEGTNWKFNLAEGITRAGAQHFNTHMENKPSFFLPCQPKSESDSSTPQINPPDSCWDYSEVSLVSPVPKYFLERPFQRWMFPSPPRTLSSLNNFCISCVRIFPAASSALCSALSSETRGTNIDLYKYHSPEELGLIPPKPLWFTRLSLIDA